MTQAETMDPAQAFINDLMARNQSMDEAMALGDAAIQQFHNDATMFIPVTRFLRASESTLSPMTQADAMDPAQAFINDLMARNQSMDEAMARGDSAIQQFYSDATVIVTGGSGFLGKQLIEKLLRATTVSKVFVLLRPKKEKEIEERFNEMLQEPVYDKLREQQPGFADRIVLIEGDVSQLRLGLSSNDWDILADQVNIIFHMAATTRLDTPIRTATMINTRGAREALLLGKACKNLKSYVHISTAFSHACTNRVDTDILEEFYLSPVPPETMIKLAESVEESRLNDIAPGLTKTWLNNYLFSKAVAEEVICSMSEDLPICVVRPAVVLHSIREPHPGWTDASCVYGASGLALSVGMGVVHAMLVDDRAQLNFIPVDYVTNATIAAGWMTAKRKEAGERNLKIYNVNTTPRNPINIGRMLPMLRNDTIPNYPPPMAVAYSLYLQTNSPAIYWIYNWLLHMIPAYIIDGVCFFLGKQRRAVKLYTKANKLIQLMTFVLLNNFDFVDKNTEALYESLSEVDREIFDFDVNKINWREYNVLWALALRKYVLKDGLTNTEYARKKIFFLKIATYAVFMLYFYLLYKVFSLLFCLLL